MHPIEACLRNPVKVAVGAILLILFGAIALLRMPMQLIPEVQTPTLSIETRWPGASPQEIEREIVQEQEEQLKSVEGVTKMTSESLDSSARITMEFLVGTNMEEALLKVNSRLQQVPQYPEEADQPVISTSNSSDRPIAWLILSAVQPELEELTAFAESHPDLREPLRPVIETKNTGLRLMRLKEAAEQHPGLQVLLPPNVNVPEMRRFAEDFIEARLERVGGVSDANVLGGLEEEMQVVIDPQQLAARQLTIDDVRRVLRNQNQDTSAGDYWEGKRRYVVRTINQFRSPEEVAAQVLTMDGGSPVFVSDVADVKLGFKKPDGLVRRFGENAIAINALRQTGANVLEVMEGIRAAVDELNDEVLPARELQLTQVYDETEYIDASVGLVNQNILVGGTLTMVVLMLFLHMSVRTLVFVPAIAASAIAATFLNPWLFVVTLGLILIAGFWFARGALVVGLAIPISIVGTFLLLNLWGRSLNVISLAGMAFAVGMLVDNAVVVLENIFRHYQNGDRPMTAAFRGTKEVYGAVLASTLTTLAVFLPVLFVEEEAGQLFRDIALAISAAVGLSLIISLTVIPTATARLLRDHAWGDDEAPARDEIEQMTSADTQPVANAATTRPSLGERLVAPINSVAGSFVNGVVGLNQFVQRTLFRRLALVVGLLAATIAISYAAWPKVEYLPTGNRNLVFGIILPPPGYNLDELTSLGSIVEQHLQPYWDVDPDSPEAAALPYPAIYDFFYVARGRQVFLGVRAVDPTRSAELIPLISAVKSKLPGTMVIAKQSSLFEQGLTAGRTIDIEITGPDLETLVALGGQVIGQVMGAPDRQGNPRDPVVANAQARPVPSLDLSNPEVHVKPRLIQSEQMGFNASSLGYAVNALVDGAFAADYFIGGDKIDLTVIGNPDVASRLQDLDSLPIATSWGGLVPLSSLATIEPASGPEQINHRERQRAVTIEVSPPPELALEDALERIEAEIVGPLRVSGQLDGGYRIALTGTADKLRATWESLRWNVLLALLITYLLMAALFESWIYPLVIILSVPLGAVGGILGLRALGVYLQWQGLTPQPLDVLTMLGFVILIGTVVNNAILIVHQSLNLMREESTPARDAIIESVRTRVRPILMTTATTVLGLCPLVLFPGSGSELYRGLGSVLLGGLLVSTIFTLVFVPTVFRLFMDIKAGISGHAISVNPADSWQREQVGKVA
ncbi:efflux RND transporter permease subunit [Allorhodopirellula heiligendammensis]|uniref:Efflux pump membrane transporter BepE n=1 Tax=Allorhodopirellula heiligendammensis TaxID=2714739 RepID=A0A5C6BTR7_9BACT|nr:efflux RND transporter permease subunit [Allorhodopirellula heiligendammensis]TWU15242.1 Efflux pump membrane transporter BepE [Allorhodopirellula heiligendammensis]